MEKAKAISELQDVLPGEALFNEDVIFGPIILYKVLRDFS